MLEAFAVDRRHRRGMDVSFGRQALHQFAEVGLVGGFATFGTGQQVEVNDHEVFSWFEAQYLLRI